MKSLLITGGAGYIGSHTVLDLLDNNYEVTIIDDLSNSKKKVIESIKQISKKSRNLHFYKIDLKNEEKLENVFKRHNFDGVIHFAGYKAVGESVVEPLKYYENNLLSTINILKLMKKYKVFNFVFSSSATVYESTPIMPFYETNPLKASNPYGRTKQYIEVLLNDLFISNSNWKIVCLRYFNPLGAHESGDLGEDPNGIPNNLVPYITQVAIGKLPYLNIFGVDYSTPDGTCIRDYVHVNDLAYGHRKALEYIFNTDEGLYEVINLGSGVGFSVFEILHSLESVIGSYISYKITSRRAGDMDVSIADISKAEELLGWKPRYDIMKMCQDTWKWQQKHPNGYDD
ncbi:UDP-glucose 4-epimerase GalE [Streptococcus pneumoniae]|uniref:UDP-glucose 4-epimerase GalE n=1 Tax=Streptococcus pneumoniae TaxID=1313 RepID=UPI0005E4627B|nr:UDP-glucose 4-epimerase GalE [Streptococcus pneumoniae]MDG7887675.1 UDP-glucose 4-epimerase GalE [Streptococcus pneumoniae]MDG7901339.1 UDP-glucose 4-epimerase GalE [Streptococcus pneumoniae]MDS2858173.1 UDP-glucose 4-epimerase GalE [Streptococcus pneumoniae]MDS3387305.1 UDP-glucose 4-epimerase GalE [Streptococcus pneumoniae]MDS4912846.1 UDP-glucose 4-epimerase GalE [Streptococcus pneumoniae]